MASSTDRYLDIQMELGVCCDHEELIGEIKRLVKRAEGLELSTLPAQQNKSMKTEIEALVLEREVLQAAISDLWKGFERVQKERDYLGDYEGGATSEEETSDEEVETLGEIEERIEARLPLIMKAIKSQEDYPERLDLWLKKKAKAPKETIKTLSNVERLTLQLAIREWSVIAGLSCYSTAESDEEFIGPQREDEARSDGQPAVDWRDRYLDIQAELGVCCDHEELIGEINRLVNKNGKVLSDNDWGNLFDRLTDKKDDEILSLKKEIEAQKRAISKVFVDGFSCCWNVDDDGDERLTDDERFTLLQSLREWAGFDLTGVNSWGGTIKTETREEALEIATMVGSGKLREIEKEMEDEGLLELKG